jgi:hypothetical protein
MGKNPNSFQKRQREMDKKRKAEDKRKRRQAQKNALPGPRSVDIAAPEDERELADR